MLKSQRYVECRACLSVISGRTSKNIFLPWSAPWSQFGSTIAVDLTRVSNVEITDDSDYPHMMCQTCCCKLYNACEFIATVQKTDDILKERCKNPTENTVVTPKCLVKSPIISCIDGKQLEWPKPIQVEKSVNRDMYRGDFDIEIKQEVLSDVEMPDFVIKIPKDLQAEKRKEVSLLGKASNWKKKKVSVANTSQSNAKNGALRNAINSSEIKVYSSEYLKCPVKDERDSDMELTLDIPLECMLCSKKLHSVSGLKAHVMSSHNYKSVKRNAVTVSSAVPPKRPATTKHTCATCRRSFSTPTDLMVHEMCHSVSVCYSCNHKFDSFDKLSRHRRRCKAANIQPSRMKTYQDAIRTKHKATLKCASCDEIFSDEYYLNIHNEIHHNSQAKSDTKNAIEKNLKISDSRNNPKGRQLIEIEILENILEDNHADTKVMKIENIKTQDGLNIEVTNDCKDTNKKNSDCVSNQANESMGLIADADVSKMSVDINVENLKTPAPQVEISIDYKDTVDGLQEHVQELAQLKECVGVVEQNTGDDSKISVDKHDESLQNQIEIVDSKVDCLQKLIQDNITEAYEDIQIVTDSNFKKSEENQIKTTDNNNKNNVHEEINDKLQELKNKETNQSTEVDTCVNTEISENKENQTEEIIPENAAGDDPINTKVNELVLPVNTKENDTVKEKINPSEVKFPEQMDNAEELDISLHNLVENIQSHIHDSDSIQMDNNSVLSDNIEDFEENSKLIENVLPMESNNDVQTYISVTDVQNTKNKLDISIETNDQEITDNNTISKDILTEENTEKSEDIDEFIKVNVMVESRIEQMETQVEEVKGNSTNKTEQKTYSNTSKRKTTDTEKVYNIKTLNPDQINLIVSENFTEIDEIIAPTKVDAELLSTVIEDDG